MLQFFLQTPEIGPNPGEKPLVSIELKFWQQWKEKFHLHTYNIFTFISILTLYFEIVFDMSRQCLQSHLVSNFNNTESIHERSDVQIHVQIHWRALLYIHIMSRSDLREGPRVLRAVISARLEKLHRNPRTARGGPLFEEAIPATGNNLAAASAEAYYYGYSPGQFIPGSFPDLLPSS